MNKMSLEEFRRIKNRIIEIMNMDTRNMSEEKVIALGDELFSLMGELTENDLSDIPFEEWKGMSLFANGTLDMSKTHANIDFALLEGTAFDKIILNGCNVRNLGEISFDEDDFDEEFIAAHPEFFPDKDLPKEIRDKFFDHILSFQDIIDYPSLTMSVGRKSFYGVSKSIVKLIGLDYALKMLGEYTDLLLDITSANNMRFTLYNEVQFSGGTYEEAKEAIFKNIIINAEQDDYEIMENDLIPEEMKKNHPEVFFDLSLLPADVLNDYKNGDMYIGQIRRYHDAFVDKNIKIGFRNNYSLRHLISLYGSLEEVLNSLPPELDAVMDKYVKDSWWNDKDEIKELFDKDRDKLYRKAIIHYLNDGHYFLDDVRNFTKYMSLEQLIYSKTIIDFINYFGFDNIINFNNKYDFIFEKSQYGYFSNDFESTFLGIVAKQQIYVYKSYPNTYEGLEALIKELVLYSRQHDAKTDAFAGSISFYNRTLAKTMPDKYIDYELFEKIFKELNIQSYESSNLEKRLDEVLLGNFNSLLDIIKDYPQMAVLFENKDITFKDEPIFNDLLHKVGMKEFLKLCVEYASFIDYALNQNDKETVFSSIFESIKNGENPNNAFNQYIYSTMGTRKSRICDITKLSKSFRDTYPELFLPDRTDVPEGLIKKFYGMKIWDNSYYLLSIRDINQHLDWIPFLDNVDLARCLEPIRICLIDSERSNVGTYRYNNSDKTINLFEYLKQYMSNREILEFLSQYAKLLDYDTVIGIPENEISWNNVKEIIDNVFYKRVLERMLIIKPDSVSESFVNNHSDIFIDEEAPEPLKNAFYQRRLMVNEIKEHPKWDVYFEGKKLYVGLDRTIAPLARILMERGISNKDIIYIIRKYGSYLLDDKMRSVNGTDLASIEENLKIILVSLIEDGKRYGEDALELVGDLCPEKFLDPSAPPELKDAFYYQNNSSLTFDILKEHRDWLDYLEGKDVVSSLTKAGLRKYNLIHLVRNLGGVKELLQLGIKNPDAVNYMIVHNKDDLLLLWYRRAKFIPHYAVMLGFPVEEIDKYLASGKLWSQIMRIEEFTTSGDAVSAMLVAAYVFGVFDGDTEGFNKFMQLFASVPGRIMEEEFKQMMEKALEGENLEEGELSPQQEVLKKCYIKGEDGSYYLNINPQRDKKAASVVRKLAIACRLTGMLTPHKAHQIFGSFAMKYEPSFREFFMANLDLILDPNNDYYTFMSTIHKRWPEIQASYSNRVLTLDMAKQYVVDNKYESVEAGNEKLAAVSAEAYYDQDKFNKLQEIYNYGKSRVHSSIPRIAGIKGRYHYEILRLDDPYAVAAGTLTKCCQEIGNHAENCMQHSMVNEHGRVFFVRDQAGNYEAQSWVWRNGNVLCFDNIEIPDKAFRRAADVGLSREEYTDEILEVYKQAAEEIMELDEAVFKQLLEAGRITEEQYDNMRIRKVTVGIGNNDIKESLIRNVPEDPGKLASPLPFDPPVKLERDWLYTDDSEEAQHVIAGEMDVRPTEEESLTVYSDEFRIVDAESMTKDILKSMANLQKHAKGLDYSDFDYYPQDAIMDRIAYNYDLDPETTRIVIHPNFYIIYCVDDGKVVLADILRSGKINYKVSERDITDIVTLQIGLALKQIKGNMEFDTSMLEPEELEIFNQAILDEQKDSERSFTHGK